MYLDSENHRNTWKTFRIYFYRPSDRIYCHNHCGCLTGAGIQEVTDIWVPGGFGARTFGLSHVATHTSVTRARANELTCNAAAYFTAVHFQPLTRLSIVNNVST